MRKQIIGIVGLIGLCIGCLEDDKDAYALVPTSVEGTLRDVRRDIPKAGVMVKLQRDAFSDGDGLFISSGFSGRTPIDSTFTDTNGTYSFDFDFDTDPSYQYTVTVPFDFGGHGPFSSVLDRETSFIEPAIMNLINFDFWEPSILALDLNVTNNINGPLGINNEDVDNRTAFLFAGASIEEEEISKTVYIPTRPGANIEINFYYSTGNSNDDVHRRRENVTLPIQDTIYLSYDIDCSTF